MEFDKFVKINGIDINKEDFNRYIDGLIGKIFAILGVYEDCTEMNQYDIFDSYIYRVICELRGFYRLTNSISFLSLSSILTDLHISVIENSFFGKNKEERHRRVKSLVFHCISMVKKEKAG